MKGHVTYWPSWMPPSAKDLIQSLLQPDEGARLSLEQVQGHRFFRGIEWELAGSLVYASPLDVAHVASEACMSKGRVPGARTGKSLQAILSKEVPEVDPGEQRLFDAF